MKISRKINILIGCVGLLLATGCKEFADVPPASNIMNAGYVFSSDGSVTNAIAGMYMNAYILTSGSFQTNIALCPSLMADELMPVGASSTTTTYEPFYRNQVDPKVTTIAELWAGYYKTIYIANAMIAGVTTNEKVLTPSLASLAKGEGLFMRAFCHFNLINLFGDVPLVTATEVYTNNKMPRETTAKVYEQIISDLKSAKELLRADYTASATSQRFRPNKYAAAALLARAYLYTGEWALAEAEASYVLGATNLYKLMPAADIAKIFYKNSPEAIWQMNGSTGTSITYNGSTEIGYTLLSNSGSSLVLTAGMEASFSTGDLRLANWTLAGVYDGKTYRVPYKYRNMFATTTATGEAYTYLRITEQFLIRSEARAQLGTDLAGAKADLDTVRTRAGLVKTTAATKSELLLAIENERKLEFFSEVGHRLFDLRRTGRASAVLSTKPGWEDYKVWLPVPSVELLNNSHLKQTNGYGQ